ncbi:hypothetical protein, partial [Sulfurovum sp.]|uniref:hypothetical protein n=1 Tax=Sulfurovum sp. TaxID=1969726 RepID=UPI0028680913
IVMFYMHLKGETLIGIMALFSMFIVLVFFVIVIGVDVANFQFGAESHISAAASGAEAHTSAPATH